MPMFNSTRRVKHSPGEMFALVADVEKYPQFLPLCEGLTVRRRTPREGGGEVLLGEAVVLYLLGVPLLLFFRRSGLMEKLLHGAHPSPH